MIYLYHGTNQVFTEPDPGQALLPMAGCLP